MYPNSYLTNGGELVTKADGTREYSIADQLGSTRVIVDESGNLQNFDYKPFGEAEDTNTTSPRIGFIGSQQDGESKYFALGARLYDPKIGRFLSPDPLLEMFPEQTPYQYAFNSPLIWKDPSGLKGEKERGDKMMSYVEETLELGEYVVVYLYYQTNDDGYCNPLVPYNKSFISKNIYRKSRDENDEAITVGDNNPSFAGIKTSGGGLSSLGSGVVNNGIISRNFKIDANWKNLSDNQAIAVREALQTIYENGGDNLLSSLSGKSFQLIFMPGATIADIYNKRNNKNNPFLLGLTMAEYICGNPTAKPTGIFPWECDLPIIMIASELLEDPTNDNFKFSFYDKNPDYFQNDVQKYYAELWFVLGHELYHFNESFLPCYNLLWGTSEGRAIMFNKTLFDNVFKHEEHFFIYPRK